MNKKLMPMTEFPYKDKASQMLLLELQSNYMCKFALGYYNMIHDVFDIWALPYMHTREYKYNERLLDEKHYSDHYCIIPSEFAQIVGTRYIRSFMMLNDALDDMKDRKMFDDNIDQVIDKHHGWDPYLLCTKDKRILISDVGCFCDIGNEFEAYSPVKINDSIYHIKRSLNRNTIQYAVDLTTWKNEQERK